MDMEMNAELERDGGSEIGEVSTEGSSAGSVYVSLEQDFARITNEMKANESLAVYEAEYTRLYESLYQAHKLEEELSEKCRCLKEELDECTGKVGELEGKIENDSQEIELLRREIYEGKKLADAAHTREQRAQEVIENLRLSVAKLNEELDQKNKQLSSEDRSATVSNKQTDNAAKENERLHNELDVLKQRLKAVSGYNKELEQKLSEADQLTTELQDKLDRQSSELSKERRDREKLDTELQAVREELALRFADLQTAEEALKTTAANSTKQEAQLRDQVLENENNQKEIQKLMLKQMTMKTDSDRLTAKHEETRKELYEKNRCLREISRELQKTKEELNKLRLEKENATKKLLRERTVSSKAEENLKRISQSLRGAELEIASLNRQLQSEKTTIDKLARDKDVAAKSITGLEEVNKKLTLEIRVLEQTNRKLESSLEDMADQANETKRQLKTLEKERDRCILEAQELAQQVEDYMDEVKMKRLEISENQKRLAEAEAKSRQQQSLFEEVRAERNTFKKNLTQTQDELNELKIKLKKLNTEMDLVREQLAEKEANLVKQEFLFSKTEKEKDALKDELADSHANIAKLREEMDELRQEEKQLRTNLQEADATILRQKKEIESVMKERDVIGTQVVRRNDELAHQQSKLQILGKTLQRGELEYAQRLREIRMLRLEISKLRFEKAAAKKSAANVCELRGELFHLERDLAKERLKVMALEEELQSPLNVHRWRNLEATDPDSFELLKKVHVLQKRIMKMSADLISKEKKIKETEELYMNLREIVSKQPGPEVLVRLTKTKRALRDRGKKLKCLLAELNMTMTTEHKFEIEKVKRELELTKAKYLQQKRRQLKPGKFGKERPRSSSSASSKPPNKFHGGGFSLTAPTHNKTDSPDDNDQMP